MDNNAFLSFDHALYESTEPMIINLIRFFLLILVYRYGKYWAFKNEITQHVTRGKIGILTKGLIAPIIVGVLFYQLLDNHRTTSAVTTCIVYIMGLMRENEAIKRGKSTFGSN